MKIICPKCQRQIPVEGVNIQSDVAFCTQCNEAFALANLVTEPPRVESPAQTKVILSRPDAGHLVIDLPRGGMGAIGCFLLVFALIWNGGVWAGFLLGFKGNRGTLPPIFFMSTFVVVGLAALCIALWLVFGRVALAMDREMLLYRRTLFNFKWQRTFPLASIQTIKRTESYKQNDRPVYGVGIHIAGRMMPLVFGSRLSEQEKDWLVYELYTFWKESTEKVKS